MKKLFSLAIVIMAISMQVVIAQNPKIILQHEGGITLYEANALQTAINAASKGDTIYLSEGTFEGPITISKRLSIIGAGTKSIISGTITITFTESDTETNHPRILDALKCDGRVAVESIINDFNIRKCWITSKFVLDNSNCKVNDGLVDRCIFADEFNCPSSHVQNLIVQNTKIVYTYGDCSNITFQNCNIYKIYNNDSAYHPYYFKGKLVNSIANAYGGEYTLTQDVIAINTLFGGYWNLSKAQCQNCYKENTQSDIISSSSLNCVYNKDALLERGYVGIDGTCVGIQGGATPWTMVPNTPVIYDTNISVDNDSNNLNVSLKVKVE